MLRGVDKDNYIAKKLMNDDKENSEHVMLVDLARNDLSRNSQSVNVKDYKTIKLLFSCCAYGFSCSGISKR